MVSVNRDAAAAGTKRCASCDAPLSGPYCSRCGERRLEPEALTLRYFLVHTVAQELLNVDGALWRTLRLLILRPGRLSLEYAAGRRRPYVNPFRLLLIAIVAYAAMSASGRSVTLEFGPVILSVAPVTVRRDGSIEGTMSKVDRYGLLRRQMAAKAEKLAGEEARERFHDRMAAFAQPASFANVFLLAAALQLLFRRKRRRFLEHAAFSMHVVSFVLLSSGLSFLAIAARNWLVGYVFLVILLVAVLQFAYVAVAIRRFYLASGRWGSRLLSVAAATCIYVLNSVFMMAVQVAGAAIALALFR
jgi:hypothetical protein